MRRRRRLSAAEGESSDDAIVVDVPEEAVGNSSVVQAKIVVADGDMNRATLEPNMTLEGPTLSFKLANENGTMDISNLSKPITMSIPTTGTGPGVAVGEQNSMSRMGNLQEGNTDPTEELQCRYFAGSHA